MYRTGHVGAALLVYAPVGFVAAAVGGASMAVLGGAVAFALASVPDLDMRVPFVPHRGPTHTAWFAGLVGVGGAVLGFALGLQTSLLMGLGVGLLLGVTAALSILSHIAADALTPMGIQPFTPWSDTRYSWDLVTAANPVANYALLGLGTAAAAGLTYLGLLLSRAV
ncbi:MAG: metal-dependent hydrolase [Halolamina sp.]